MPLRENISGPSRTTLLSGISLFVVAIIWGSGFIGTQLALDAKLSSACIMFGRFAIATVVIGLCFFKDLRRSIKPQHIKGGLIIGLLLFLAFYVQTVGLQYTTPANNAFITAANVVIVPFLWWAISKKRPSVKIFISSFLCLVGIGILSINFSSGISLGMGDLLTLASAFLFACQIIATGILAKSCEPKVIVFLQFLVATILSFIMFILTDGDFSALASPQGMGSVLYLGVFSTCICYLLQTTAQRHVPASKAALILSTESLFGSLFSVLMGYDKLSVNMVVGGFIILASILMAEIKFPALAKTGKREMEADLLFEEEDVDKE